MKKIRGSIIAKLIAWILFLAGVAATVVSGVIFAVGFEEDCYGRTYGEVIEQEFEFINRMNSIEAYRYNIDYGVDNREIDEYFKYGIIEADTLRGIDFSQPDSYVIKNFTKEELDRIANNPNKLFLYEMVRYKERRDSAVSNGYYENYLDDEGIFSYVSSQSQNTGEMATEWVGLYADRVCYDINGGIFYYRAERKYYPVQNVTLTYTSRYDNISRDYNYSYDFGKKAYTFNYVWSDNWENQQLVEIYDNGITEDVMASSESRYMDDVENLLMGDGLGHMITFNKLDNTDFNYRNWDELLLDNVRSINSNELTLIDSTNILKELFVDEAGYYLNENYTLMVAETYEPTTYWIVSLIPPSNAVPAILNSDSRYSQTQWELHLVYYLGYGVIGLLVGAVIVTIMSFVFLAYAAGHRKNTDEIVKVKIVDQLPLELLTFAMIAICGFLYAIAINATAYMFGGRYASIGIGLSLTLVFVATLIFGWYLLSFIVRIKGGKWWHSTICYWIYRALRKCGSVLIKNIGLLWKVIAILAVISFIEFIGIIACWYDQEILLFLWMIEKLIICAVSIWLVLQMRNLQEGSKRLANGDLQYKINTNKMFWECKKHGENLNKIGDGMSKAVEERIKSERLKTELITNVSHDIKTPLTSIINYVDLLGKEQLDNAKAVEYLEVLDRQSAKLKKLIEDLVEASKASSGNLTVESEQLEAGVFITQTVGEFEERLANANLELIVSKPDEPLYIMADGRHLWRVVDNIMNNICKYAQPHSRVYVNLEATGEDISMTFRNMSQYPLNIKGDELMERFVRGDKSRNTEGHGLGLSIAKSLMDLMKGEMDVYIDGDLFKVVLKFNRILHI